MPRNLSYGIPLVSYEIKSQSSAKADSWMVARGPRWSAWPPKTHRLNQVNFFRFAPCHAQLQMGKTLPFSASGDPHATSLQSMSCSPHKPKRSKMADIQFPLDFTDPSRIWAKLSRFRSAIRLERSSFATRYSCTHSTINDKCLLSYLSISRMMMMGFMGQDTNFFSNLVLMTGVW